MNIKLLLARTVLLLVLSAPFLLFRTNPVKKLTGNLSINGLTREVGEEKEEEKAEFTSKRMAHEFKMLRNPVTGKIPANIREIEDEVSAKVPDKGFASGAWLRGGSVTVQNAYRNIGPDNVGGRGRGLAFDRRNANIMITGGVTGGIFRSTNGGTSWTFVSGDNDIRSATSIVQDPVNPDTWYCGTGETWTTDLAFTVGHGVFKSTNNGASWTKLASTADANPNQFNGQFDLVHRLAVHPTTSHIYAAVHNRLMKSSDGGQTWQTVLGGQVANNSIEGLCDVIIPSNGSKIFAAFSGKNQDRSLAGIWESTTGNSGAWTRIAGGTSGATDSVAGWKAHGVWSRAVMALNNANTRLFVLYKNGKSADGATPEPEADLFRADISSGTPSSYTWTNLNSYVPDEPGFNYGGIDPYTTQFEGYNMAITVKPDNDNILFVGGVTLVRVDLSKTDPAQKFRRIGGYGQNFFPQPENFIYPNHHPDVHGIYFVNGANDALYTVSDGGVHKTSTSVMADTVRWQPLNANLQTMQYYAINIQPDLDADFIIGGTQDNGTQVNLNPGTSLEHFQITGGDGVSASISSFTKNGNLWTQYWYTTLVEGAIRRVKLELDLNTSTIDVTAFDDITPTGNSGNGQWTTLFVNDPDSTEHIYYNNKNKIYRTRNASTVTASSWTEITGVRNTLSASEEVSAMAISKSRNNIKYLYFGTDAGKVYRLNNPNTGAASITPVNITPNSMTAGSYVSGVSVNPRSPDTVLVVVSNYDGNTPLNNIFWTGNATSATPTWQVIDGALGPVSSQSCAIVLRKSGVEYYVGTSIGLYSTTAISGNSTQWFNEGSGMLKRAIVRSLINRQRDNTLVVGTHGNGAFAAEIGDAVALDNNIVTGINDPVTNDKNFIQMVYPTLTQNEVLFRVGNMFTIKSLTIELFGVNGQKLIHTQQPYQNGSIKLGQLSSGSYILQITSNDGKYRHVQKITKN